MPLRQLTAIAWRNLWRNPRRTVITFSMMSIGLGLLIFSTNFAEGAYNDMISTGVSQISGHVVLRNPRYEEASAVGNLLTGERDLTDVVHRINTGIKVCPRIEVQALLVSARGSAAVQLSGIDPPAEALVTGLHEKIIKGHYLSWDEPGVILGLDLAAVLDVAPGEKVVATVQGEHDLASQLFRVAGIFRTGAAEVDGSMAQIPLRSAQAMLEKPDSVSALTLHLHDPANAPELAATLREEIDDPTVEVLTWKEAVPALRSYIEVDRAGNHLFLGVIGLLVTIGVLNTTFMALHERRHESGLLLALGTPPKVLVLLTVLETLFLAMLSSIAGIWLGLLATWPVARWGIDFSSLYGESLSLAGLNIDTRIFAEVRVFPSLLFALALIFTAIVAATWPAIRNTSLEPVHAMHEP